MTDLSGLTECKTPGLCECPDMPHCAECGYTEHDARFHGDHHLCPGVIPKRPEHSALKGETK